MAISFWELLEKYRIVIPKLQRDYAQGRVTGKVPKIRENILNAICKSIKEAQSPLELDFIYGYTKISNSDDYGEQTIFYPLDGQQRLTTLFLFHWYVAAKEDHLDKASVQKFSKFTYETRHSSRVFCSELVKYIPDSFDIPIKESIINQPWFFTAWNNDPTINSMLTMLNAIQEKIFNYKLENVWKSLSNNPAVVFHLLPMDKLGLPDDLYIKMNSRGKELTEFEYFKIRFSEILNDSQIDTFNHRIDLAWSDLFWDLYKDDNTPDIAKKVDAAFLRFFRFVTDIIIAKTDAVLQENLDEFDLFGHLYSKDENVMFLFSILDLFVSNKQKDPNFFSSNFYIDINDYSLHKTRLHFVNASTDLFKKCSDCYDPTQRSNPFSIGEQLLLYACIVQLLNNTIDFSKKIRKLRNLISNSEDTLRKEYMSSLLNSVYEIIINNKIDSESKFNTNQINEETEKSNFIMQNPQMIDTICRLEDHDLLRGCIAIFNLSPDLGDYAMQFHNVFSMGSDYDSISCALLTFGDYSQKIGLNRRLGNNNNSVWRELFTPSQKRGYFDNTKEVLYKFLGYLITVSSGSITGIVDSYLAIYKADQYKEKDWRYYFVRYPEFRNHEYGFYYWPDSNKQYECFMLRRQYLNGFYWDPYLFAIEKAIGNVVSLGKYGEPLIYVKDNATLKIINKNEGIMLEAIDSDGENLIMRAFSASLITSENLCAIMQSPEGVDKENRVEKGIDLINHLNKI